MIHNPILPGFNPDPCICRKGDDFYIAASSFEWFPGIPVYHSRDMKHWELYSHVLTDPEEPNLKGLPSAKGIWAPCLTYDEKEDLFYVVYGVMNSMNARYFDIDNFLITAKDLRGPWSKPVYLHSAGFDASLFHDDDGRKYVVALEWETRTEYEKPGSICIVEYDPSARKIKGIPKPFWRGATDRGCIEAPHLTKHNGWYYIMCAEGGTGYYHCATMGRSRNVFGPYEPDPHGPIVTSCEANVNERADWDHLKPRYYNPASYLQKSGHASYVDLPNGETWLAHLTARPFVTDDPDPRKKYRCTLGRETAIERATWTDDGWLRLAGDVSLANGRNLAGGESSSDIGNLADRERRMDSGNTVGGESLADDEKPAGGGSLADNGKPAGGEGLADNGRPTDAGGLAGDENLKRCENLAQEYVGESSLPVFEAKKLPEKDDFDEPALGIGYYAPRISPASFIDLTARPGWIRLRGQESGTSLNKASILARKLTSVHTEIETKMDFTPDPGCWQQTAGLTLYYDNMNFFYLYKYYSETLQQNALSIIELDNGVKKEYHHIQNTRTPVSDGRNLLLKAKLDGRDVQFQWAYEGEAYRNIGPVFDLSKLSDEYSDYGEFTGTMAGITCADRLLHTHTADFDFFRMTEES